MNGTQKQEVKGTSKIGLRTGTDAVCAKIIPFKSSSSAGLLSFYSGL